MQFLESVCDSIAKLVLFETRNFAVGTNPDAINDRCGVIFKNI